MDREREAVGRLGGFKVLLLDMNSTFMFGEDRFGSNQDYARTYTRLGGKRLLDGIPGIVERVVEFLAARYPEPAYRESFPSIAAVLQALPETGDLPEAEHTMITGVIAEHECGSIPDSYAGALISLARRFRLGLVADIWAPKDRWLEEFRRTGIAESFEVAWFSSDHGIVKPSPHPFRYVVDAMGADPATTLVIGDSVRRDLGGATAAGLPCLLVGGATDPGAYAVAASLLELGRS